MKNSTIFKFLSISLFLCPLFSSAMEPEKASNKASDFEIYQLLSFGANNNPEFYLPTELVHAIAITACDITKAREIAEVIEAARIEAARVAEAFEAARWGMDNMRFLPAFA